MLSPIMHLHLIGQSGKNIFTMFMLARAEYQKGIKAKYSKVNFIKKLIDLERRFDFDLEAMPELKERLFKFRL